MLTIVTHLLMFQVIISCSRRIPIKNVVFMLFDHIVLKLLQQIRRRKKTRIKTLYKRLLAILCPSKSN